MNNSDKKVVNYTLKKGEEELTKLKYGQGSIKLRLRYNKNGSVYKWYEGRYYSDTGQIKYVYAKTVKDCVKQLKEVNPLRKNNPARKKLLTLQDWMLTWYNDFKKGTLRPTSQHGYEYQMKNQIFPALGKTKLYAKAKFAQKKGTKFRPQKI